MRQALQRRGGVFHLNEYRPRSSAYRAAFGDERSYGAFFNGFRYELFTVEVAAPYWKEKVSFFYDP
jgi:hypothetical protein